MQPSGTGMPMRHRSGTAHAWDSSQPPRWQQQQQQRPNSRAWTAAWMAACRARAQSRGMGPRPQLLPPLHAWAAEQQLQPRLHANLHAWTGADAGAGTHAVRSLMTKKQRRWQTAAVPRQHVLPPSREAVPHCWLEVTERGVSVGGLGGRGGGGEKREGGEGQGEVREVQCFGLKWRGLVGGF